MAVITATTATPNVPYEITRTALSASDTLTYVGNGQYLNLYNTTASPVVVTITGSTATTISPAGYGGTISVAAGKAITVGCKQNNGCSFGFNSAYLSGTITVTGGTGVTAHCHQRLI